MAEQVQYYGTGRRKSSVARVFLRPGSGKLTVNGREFDKYFLTGAQRVEVKQPLVTSETSSTFDITANVSGGGINGQAGALKMGIARALLEFNIELRKKLKAEGFLSRDARGKERKKYGQKGARKRFQFSKTIIFSAGTVRNGARPPVLRVWPSFLYKFNFAHPPWDPDGGAERLITGIKIFPPASTGAEQGINPERAGCAAEDAIQ